MAAIAALFSPVPAMAAPAAPVAPVAPAIPDAGARPTPVGALVLPGQGTTTTPNGGTAITGVPTLTMTPTVAKIEKKRAAVALLGSQVLEQNEAVTLARTAADAATRRQADAHTATLLAEQDVTAAAADAFQDAAALPPGTLGSDLVGFGALAGIQRGEGAGEQAAGRHLVLAREAEQAAVTDAEAASIRLTMETAKYNRLNTQLQREQAALQKLETANAAEVAANEARERAIDVRLGAGYVGGSASGQAADPRALAAVTYFLSKRGDPYVWGAEGPDAFDCSGAVFAAYHTKAAGSYPMPRVSIDQYQATKGKLVDRYSLIPGDLLFFSFSNSWTGIHHVAMYAGNGMMVEAPRTGLNVRLVPVRWTRLFAATRVYGPVPGPAHVPPGLDQPDPSPRPLPSRSHPPTTPTSHPTSKPPTTPTSKPPVTTPSSVPPTTPSSSPPPSPSSPTPTPGPTSNDQTPSPKPSLTSAASTSAASTGASSTGASSTGASSTGASSTGASSTGASSSSASRVAGVSGAASGVPASSAGSVAPSGGSR